LLLLLVLLLLLLLQGMLLHELLRLVDGDGG